MRVSPELHCALREPGKDAIERGLVYVPPQSDRDIPDGTLRREVVISAQRLNFLRHDGAVLERSPGLVRIPICHKDGTQHGRQHTGEEDGLLDVKAAAKDLQDPLHHRVNLMGGRKARRPPRIQ
jgi:hypothetical protein